MSDELDPCPFCGGSDLVFGGDDKFVGCVCSTCEARGPNHYGGLEWNTRTDSTKEAEHIDDIAVCRFSDAMKQKLAKKRQEGRGGWDNKDECSNVFLSELLREHIDKGDPVDVANLAMMIHQRGERIVEINKPKSAAEAQLHAIVDAWEALPGGRQVRNSDVEAWLAQDMGPAIDRIRGFLRRMRPDGVTPAPPALPIPDPAGGMPVEVK